MQPKKKKKKKKKKKRRENGKQETERKGKKKGLLNLSVSFSISLLFFVCAFVRVSEPRVPRPEARAKAGVNDAVPLTEMVSALLLLKLVASLPN
jgi:hypothetical protein